MDTQCVKVASLRSSFPEEKEINFFKWMEKEGNLYVGRKGRITIDGQFLPYEASKWENPFKVKDMPVEESLEKYRNFILSTGLRDELSELKGLTLGCFCDQSEPCHAKVLVELVGMLDNLPQPTELQGLPEKKERKKKEAKSKDEIVLCSGKTKKGDACKNRAKDDGRCHLHKL